MLKTFEHMDQERKAVRERELPEWALALPKDRQDQILLVMRRAAQPGLSRLMERTHGEADAILYGAKI